MGKVEHIHRAPEASQPMVALREVEVIAGQGIRDDRYAKKVGHYSANPTPGRHVTLIEAEVIEAITQQHGIPFAPHQSRRNLTTRGLPLNPLVGKKLRIGEVTLDVIRWCDPCRYLEQLVGQPILKHLVDRGGLRCDVLIGGLIRVGDAITVFDDAGDNGCL